MATSVFSSIVNAVPATTRNISQAFVVQDKICSINFDPKDGSYWRFFEQVSGFRVPSYLSKHTKTPYTGFKFLRTYSFQPTSLNSETNLLVAFCSEGKVQWDLYVPVKEDIEWKKPLCVYTAPKVNEVSEKKQKVWGKIFRKDDFLAKKEKSRKEKALEDLDNFHCFKLARRKKYFNRSMSLFFPGSWVGGMYFCDLTNESKEDLVNQMDSNLLLKEYSGREFCTPENAIPLMPIESDDYSKTWSEYKSSKWLSFLGRVQDFRVTKYVPFLYTPNSPMEGLNVNGEKAPYPAISTFTGKIFREQLLAFWHGTESVTNAHDPWFTEIEVSEDYSFTKQEHSRLGFLNNRTREALADARTSAFAPAKHFISSSASEQPKGRTDRRVRKLFQNLEGKLWDHLSTYDKDLAIMGSDNCELQQLEKRWKSLHLSD